MKTQNKYARCYIRSVLHAVPCGFWKKRQLRSKLLKVLQQYDAENPDSTYEDLEQAFGPAEEFAKELSSDISPKMRRTRIVVHRSICAVLALCIVAVIGYTVSLQNKWDRLLAEEIGHGEITSEEIEETVLSTKEDIDLLTGPDYYGMKYNLTYVMKANTDDVIESAFDENEHEVSVDADGKPLDKNYPVSSEFQEWYDSLPEK